MEGQGPASFVRQGGRRDGFVELNVLPGLHLQGKKLRTLFGTISSNDRVGWNSFSEEGAE